MENKSPNIPEHDERLVSSPLLSDNSKCELEYLSQKYPKTQNDDKFSKGARRIPKNARMKSFDGNKANKTEKSQSLRGNKEEIKPLSKSKVTIKSKESKRDSNLQETKKELKDYLIELENKIEKQQKKLKNIKTSLEERKNNFQEYSKNLKETKKLEKLIETYENEKQRFEKNEIYLIKNLSDQQKLTKDALNKLYYYQEEGLKEKDQIRDFYEMQLKEQLSKMENKYKNKIKTLKKTNNELILNKKGIENKGDELINNHMIEINSLKNQLNLQIKENETLIKENFNLKTEVKERRERVESDLNQLKSKMLMDNETLIRDNEEKVYLKQKVQALTKDLELKEKKTRENEEFYKQEIDKMEEKISVLQEKFSQSQEYKVKIEELTEMLKRKENECHIYKNMNQDKPVQKPSNQANQNQFQKQQWGKIYNELLDEIKGLKFEIDQLGSENKRLLSSVSNNRTESQAMILSSNRL